VNTTFDVSLARTLQHEGGYVNDPADPGGATYAGVSLRFLRAAGEDIDGDGDIDEADIAALRQNTDDIVRLYHTHFWRGTKADEIKSALVADKVFDMAVNVGPRQAWKIVQRAANDLSDGTRGLTEDGIPGPKTLFRVNAMYANDYELLARIRTYHALFYNKLVEDKPQLAKFLHGWLRRAAA
jgi:lysozyme family protein